jgi:hypothetical protein
VDKELKIFWRKQCGLTSVGQIILTISEKGRRKTKIRYQDGDFRVSRRIRYLFQKKKHPEFSRGSLLSKATTSCLCYRYGECHESPRRVARHGSLRVVMSSLALGVPLTMVTVLGLLLNGYIMLVVVLTKQVHTLILSLSCLPTFRVFSFFYTSLYSYFFVCKKISMKRSLHLYSDDGLHILHLHICCNILHFSMRTYLTNLASGRVNRIL